MPLYTVPDDHNYRRAVGALPPPLLATVRTETAGPSAFAWERIGVRSETRDFAPRTAGDLFGTRKGDYVYVRETYISALETFRVDRLKLDIGEGSRRLVDVDVGEGAGPIFDYEAAVARNAAENAARQAQNVANANSAQPQPNEPPPPESSSDTGESGGTTGRAETREPVRENPTTTRPAETAPSGGCETRTLEIRLDDGSTELFEEHYDGGGWTGVG